MFSSGLGVNGQSRSIHATPANLTLPAFKDRITAPIRLKWVTQEAKAIKLLTRIFEVPDLTWLLEQPEFLSAANQMKIVDDALAVFAGNPKSLEPATIRCSALRMITYISPVLGSSQDVKLPTDAPP